MLAGLSSIAGFVVIMTVLIVIHEAGHFFVAKLAKVKVLEFGIGFPPRLWGIRYRDTLYSINAIPLGGFVRMLGEEDPSESGSLAGRGTGIRFLVMAAGPFMNLILTVLLLSRLASQGRGHRLQVTSALALATEAATDLHGDDLYLGHRQSE